MVGPENTNSFFLLLVEDDALDQQWVKRLLNRVPNFDYQMVWAQTFKEAETLLANLKFDIAFVDYTIGARSGIELLEAFGGRDAPTPMVMLTGNDQYSADLAAMKAGAYDYLDKSKLDEQQLERVIRYVGKTRKLELELKEALDVAQAADEAKVTFLSNMSHDLRTPLNAIVGFSELLLGGNEYDEDTLGYLNLIHSSGKHLTSMVNDIMLLTQFETDTVDVSKEDCDLIELMPSVVGEAQYAATARNIDVRLSLKEDYPTTIKADCNAAHRMLVNVLASACDLTRPGEIVSVSLLCDNEGTSVVITSHCEKLSSVPLMQMTQPFQVPSKDYASDSVYRIGLSLAIAYRIAQLHGAVLDVNPLENGETCFKVFFPAFNSNLHVMRA